MLDWNQLAESNDWESLYIINLFAIILVQKYAKLV